MTALGCKARPTLVSRRVRLWDWVRCTAFNLQAVLYSLLLVLLLFLFLLLLCLCLCGCLALPSWTLLVLASSHTTLNHSLYALYSHCCSPRCVCLYIFLILGLFIYSLSRSLHTQKTSRNFVCIIRDASPHDR